MIPAIPDSLAVKVFENLYPEYLLLTIGGRYVVVPAGVTVLESDSIGAIARHISKNSDTELADMLTEPAPLPQRHPH